MRKVLVLAAMAASAVVASPALAAPTITFASLADGTTSATFADTGIGTGAFSDLFQFTLPTGLVSSTISSVFTTDQTNNLDFSTVTLNNLAYNVLSTGQVEFRSLLADPITAGVQTLVVAGTSGGNSSYSGTISFSPLAAAVPEPATWLTMILGMGAVGFALRRRKNVTTRVQFA